MLKERTIKSNNLSEKSFVISIRSNNDFLLAKAIPNKSDNVSSQYYSAMRGHKNVTKCYRYNAIISITLIVPTSGWYMVKTCE
jgi:hypothetical protein